MTHFLIPQISTFKYRPSLLILYLNSFDGAICEVIAHLQDKMRFMQL